MSAVAQAPSGWCQRFCPRAGRFGSDQAALGPAAGLDFPSGLAAGCPAVPAAPALAERAAMAPRPCSAAGFVAGAAAEGSVAATGWAAARWGSRPSLPRAALEAAAESMAAAAGWFRWYLT